MSSDPATTTREVGRVAGPRATGGGRLRAVVGDDSTAMLVLLCTLLERMDVAVVGEAGDGVGTVTLALGLRPDLVVLPADLPVLGGFAVAELIEWQEPGTQILLHADEPGERTYRRAAAAGAQLVDRADLPETIREIVAGRPPHPALALG